MTLWIEFHLLNRNDRLNLWIPIVEFEFTLQFKFLTINLNT